MVLSLLSGNAKRRNRQEHRTCNAGDVNKRATFRIQRSSIFSNTVLLRRCLKLGSGTIHDHDPGARHVNNNDAQRSFKASAVYPRVSTSGSSPEPPSFCVMSGETVVPWTSNWQRLHATSELIYLPEPMLVAFV